MKYDFTAIEKKWQQKWLEEKPFTAVTGDQTREKFFGLIEFPYPSGQGLHVGHARPFTAMDIICRKKRMQGYNVLFPIGYDAFGLPRRTTPSSTRSTPPRSPTTTWRTSASSCTCWVTPSTGTGR